MVTKFKWVQFEVRPVIGGGLAVLFYVPFLKFVFLSFFLYCFLFLYNNVCWFQYVIFLAI